MLHRERVIPPPGVFPADEWNLIETKFSPKFAEMSETIFSLSNGYLGMRGCFEEGAPVVNCGTYVNGFHETWPIVYGEEAYGYAKTGQTIVNVADSRIIKLYVDDEPFYPPRAHLLSFDRRLNMKTGTLDREILWETPAGKHVLIKSRRLVSLEHRHLAAISYEVTVLNSDAPVVLSSEITVDHAQTSREDFDPRNPAALQGTILHPRSHYFNEKRAVLCHDTERSDMIIASAIDHQLETDCAFSYLAKCSEDTGQVVFTIDAAPGRPIRLIKYMSYHTSATAPPQEMCDRVERTLDRAVSHGLDELHASQERYLEKFWRTSDVQLSGIEEVRALRTTVEIQQAIRFNLFHVLQASARAEGTGVPAKGLTGHAYEGHYFWDTEIYLLPFLIYTSPGIAKNILMFRYNMLDQARLRAQTLSLKGAAYPWRTINGDEASADYAAGTAQYHINADIMYALRKYVHATGDVDFLEHYGAEMLIETARLWSSLGFFSERAGGKFCIHGVTGPDEYNTVVNNNTYTNLMARENLRYAVDVVKTFEKERPHVFRALAHRTGLDISEVDTWQRAADNMYVAYDEQLGIYPQDDGFLSNPRWDFENTPPEKYPLLLNYHPLTIYRHQVIKQADIVLVMFLLEHEFSLEAKQRNFRYYDPLTTGDSSLSSCIQAIVAAEIGEFETALTYARVALLMDLADVGGNVKDGVHIASMGGCWMALAYGFAGMRDHGGKLSFQPRKSPGHDAKLGFSLRWRGSLLHVHMGTDSARYTLLEGDELTIRHGEADVSLTRAEPTQTRPITRPETG